MNNTFKIIKSIFAINPEAEYTFEKEDIDNIQWINGTTPISESDLEAKMSTIEAEIEQVETDKTNKKASGKAKLKELGLDDAEIKALTGS